MCRRASAGDAFSAEARSGSSTGGSRRGFRHSRRDRRDRFARRPGVSGARRQTPGKIAPEQPVAVERDEHQDRSAESGLQQVDVVLRGSRECEESDECAGLRVR